MSKSKISVPLAVCMLLAAQASAQTASSPAKPDTVQLAPAPEAAAEAPPKRVRIICVKTEADTGSHFGAHKECHTEDEWAMIHSQTAYSLEQYRAMQTRSAPPGARNGP